MLTIISNSNKYDGIMGISGGPVVKNPPANAGDTRDVGLIPGLGRSPGGENGTPLHYSCLKKKKNLTNRGAWQAIVQQVAKSWTWTSNWACVCCGSVVSNSLQHNGLQHTRLRYLQEFAQTRVQWVGDAIQPSHPLLTLPVCRALTYSTVSSGSTHIVP